MVCNTSSQTLQSPPTQDARSAANDQDACVLLVQNALGSVSISDTADMGDALPVDRARDQSSFTVESSPGAGFTTAQFMSLPVASLRQVEGEQGWTLTNMTLYAHL